MSSTSRICALEGEENEVLRASANRGNICRKMADVSSLIHNFYNIEIGLVSEIHHSSIKIYTHTIFTQQNEEKEEKRREEKTANSHKYQIENTRMNIAYNVRFFSCVFTLRFISFLSFFFRLA